MIFAAMLGGVRLAFIFQALAATSLSSVHAIMQGSPIVVMFFGHFFLGDSFNIVRCFCALMLVAGITLTAMPEDLNNVTAKDIEVIKGVFFAISVMLMSGLGTCLMKPLSKRFDKVISQNFLYFSI